MNKLPSLLTWFRKTLSGKKILLGVSGSIAAFKANEIVRLLKACGAEVQVILTEGGTQFVSELTLETLSGRPVLTDLWHGGEKSNQVGTHHIATARWADAFLVAPASANVIARFANGMALDLLSSEALAFRGPFCVAPAMNPAMYNHPGTKANLSDLRERGVRILGPGSGDTACGEEGEGRMLEPEQVVLGLATAFFAPARNERALISLGPTTSDWDPVRFLTNRSKGTMGMALAAQALMLGFDVEIVSGLSVEDFESRFGSGHEALKVHHVRTTAQMRDAVMKVMPYAKVFCSTAAVLDWEFEATSTAKVKKKADSHELRLRPTPDILAEVGRLKPSGLFVLGFAAETPKEDAELEALARGKLEAKNCDAVFANPVTETSGFETTTNRGVFVTPKASVKLGSMPKVDLAERIWKLVQEARGG